MTVMLAAIGCAFVAFAVWLTVWLVKRRKSWAKCTAVGVALPVIYVLSIGPAIFAVNHGLLPESFGETIYKPVWWPCEISDIWCKVCLLYTVLWGAEGP